MAPGKKAIDNYLYLACGSANGHIRSSRMHGSNVQLPASKAALNRMAIFTISR